MKKVLLVEDNAINQKISSRFLEISGLEVTIAQNGQEAVEKSQVSNFDLILMDCHMPVMDGLEATRQISALQKSGKIANTPILCVTAYDFENDRHKYMEAGAHDIMSKLQLWNNVGDILKRYIDIS